MEGIWQSKPLPLPPTGMKDYTRCVGRSSLEPERGGWPFWEVALMWIGMIAFWGLIIWAVYFLVVSATRRSDRDRGDDGPRRILDQRLAKGEIDAEEYGRVRDLIAHDDRGEVGAGGGR